jgi:kynurenine formamidase
MNWITLSHTLNTRTPAFGGDEGLAITATRSIDKGDSCNVSQIRISNHL